MIYFRRAASPPLRWRTLLFPLLSRNCAPRPLRDTGGGDAGIAAHNADIQLCIGRGNHNLVAGPPAGKGAEAVGKGYLCVWYL